MDDVSHTIGGGPAGGGVTTGTLIAREIERAHAGQPATGHDVHEPCANCGTMRQGPFCHGCGQAGHVHRDAFALVHDLAHGVFHFEGKIWKTLPLLTVRPGELTRRYVAGERAKFVSPIALFLFSIFLLFAIVPNMSGSGKKLSSGPVADGELISAETQVQTFQSLATSLPTEAARARAAGQLAAARARLAAIKAERAGRPAAAVHAGMDDDNKAHLRMSLGKVDTGIEFIDYPLRHLAENPDLTIYKLTTYAYKYSWALIPISVPFIWLMFAFRRDVGFYDHAIFAIYSISFMSIGAMLLSVLNRIGFPGGLTAAAILLVPPVHMYRQLKGAYALGRFGAAWRTAGLLLVAAIASILFLCLVIYMGSH